MYPYASREHNACSVEYHSANPISLYYKSSKLSLTRGNIDNAFPLLIIPISELLNPPFT